MFNTVMTTSHLVKIDPDKRASENADRLVWATFEEEVGATPVKHFTNHRMDWAYHQYCIWYDSIMATTPIRQLSREEDYE